MDIDAALRYLRDLRDKGDLTVRETVRLYGSGSAYKRFRRLALYGLVEAFREKRKMMQAVRLSGEPCEVFRYVKVFRLTERGRRFLQVFEC